MLAPTPTPFARFLAASPSGTLLALFKASLVPAAAYSVLAGHPGTALLSLCAASATDVVAPHLLRAPSVYPLLARVLDDALLAATSFAPSRKRRTT